MIQKKADKVEVDFERVLQHALRSWAAYHTPYEVESGYFNPEVPVFDAQSLSRESLSLGSLGMFLELQADGSQWVAIRGSQNFGNIRDNLQYAFEFIPELNLHAHKGFAALYRKAWQELKPRLDKYKPVKVTGHSLGGAVASLLALGVMKSGYRVTEVVTFGAPKFTDFEGSVEFLRMKVPLLRITNAGDVVPACPPWEQYVHAGAQLHLLGNDPLTYTWVDASRAAVAAREPVEKVLPRLTSVPNHLLSDYLQNMLPKLPNRKPELERLFAAR